MIHWIPLGVVAFYIVALFVVTWWAQRLTSRHGGGLIGYLMAGRQLPAWVAAALIAGLAVGGASTIGVAEQAFKKGISAGWYNAAWAAGAFVVGLVAARKYRNTNMSTIPEMFEQHYGPTARIIGVVGQLVIQIVITSLQYVAGGAILSSLMPEVFSFNIGMLATAIIFVSITLIGGFWAAGLTNVINVIAIYIGIGIGVILTMNKVGGFASLSSRLPTGHPGFDLKAVGIGVIAAWFIVMITQAHSTQAIIQVGLAAKDERAAKRGFIWGGVLILPVGFMAALLGMAAAILHPEVNPTEALPKVVLDLPPLAAGIVLAGLWAADVSTASGLLMGSATLVCNDIIKRFFNPNLGAAKEQLVCRLTVLGISVLTFLLALTVRGILQMLLIGLTLSTAYTLTMLATFYCRGLCRRSTATVTLLATAISLGAWLIAPASWRFLPHPIYFTWIIGLAAFFIVAAFDRRKLSPLS